VSIESPCIGVCKLDSKGFFCKGCRRTLEEISNWKKYSNSKRKKILSLIKGRQNG